MIEVHRYDVAGFQHFAKALDAFAGIEFTGRDGIAEKDAGETLGQNDPAAGRTKRDGRVLARTAAAEILSADNKGILGIELALLHEANGVKRIGKAAHRVTAEFFIFVRHRGNQGQVLRGNDLVGVDVVTDDIDRAGKDRLHRLQSGGRRAGFQSEYGIGGSGAHDEKVGFRGSSRE